MFSFRRWDLLVAVYIFCIVGSELMGAKTFVLFQHGSFVLNASVAIFLFPLIFTINDMIIEVYGKKRARSVVRSGLFVVFLTFVFSLLAISLPPSARFGASEAAYDTIFGYSARFAAASLIAFAVAEFTDIFIFAKIRERMHGKALWFRNNLSNFIAQFLDTTIFLTLAFYALDRGFGDNVAFLVSIILPYWLLKCAMSVIETPLLYAGIRWLKGERDTDAPERAELGGGKTAET